MRIIVLNIILLFIVISTLHCYAQNLHLVDSLEKIVNSSKVDTLKVNALNQLFLLYEFEDDIKAKKCLSEAMELSKKNNYKKGLATTYMQMGFFAEDKCNYTEALKNYNASLKVRKASKDFIGIAETFCCIGIVFDIQGDYSEALKNYNNSKKIYEVLGAKHGVASNCNNIGIVFTSQGNYPQALINHFNALKIREEIGDIEGVSSSYCCIGNVYRRQNNYIEAMKNYNASLKIEKKLNNKPKIATIYNNIGLIYKDQANFKKALSNFIYSQDIKEKLGDKNGLASSYYNIGAVYYDQAVEMKNNSNKYSLLDLALDKYFAALKIKEEIGDKAHVANILNSIGNILTIKKRYTEAKLYLLRAKNISEEIGHQEYLRNSYVNLSNYYYSIGNFKDAYNHHKLYILYRDSIDNQESRKKTVQTQMTYEFEKKEAVAKAEHKKELENQDAIANEKSRKQRIIIMFVVIGLLLVVIFAGFIYRSLRITRKQKKTIELQKQEVDEKNLQLNQQNEEIRTQRDEIEAQRDEIEAQRDLVTEQKVHIEEIHKEVTDSINYAKRIQEALLPVSDSARSVLGEHFVLFKPKNIVSGDFYWTTKINNLLFVAVADCTGHGVPGAFMSMLGISFLNEIVQKQEINKASQILNQLRLEIINALQQKGVSGEQKDGMDISLLVLNTETNEAQWAGANNPLYIISSVILNGSEEHFSCEVKSNFSKIYSSATPLNDNYRLIELKGDKMPIAIYPVMNDFTNHEFKLNKGDSVYLFTDGYADQFGGPKGRKFMYKQFKELLVHNSAISMQEQKVILENAFEKWTNGFEQIDDVTLVGIKM